MSPRFVQLHLLTSYPASLLNRDDAGFAKRIPFGGTTRTRISSQCLKRHWRTHEGSEALSRLGDLSVRSRLSFERYVIEPLVAEGMPRERALAATEGVMGVVLGSSAKAKKSKKESEEGPVETGQITVLGLPELEYLRSIVRVVEDSMKDLSKEKDLEKAVKAAVNKDELKNLAAIGKAAGIDAALFGRMVTSDILARGDAAVHVAHAFTVHAEASESDYFSAVDDLKAGDSLGSGHIGNTELNTGLYYTYVAVDVPLLVSNLSGCKREDWEREKEGRELASKVADWLVRVAATVSPGAKVGSTAPYAYAQMLLAEAGSSQPRSLANAFLRPVDQRGDLLLNSFTALKAHVDDLDRMYGKSTEKKGAAMGPVEALGGLVDPKASLTEIAEWAGVQVRGGAK